MAIVNQKTEAVSLFARFKAWQFQFLRKILFTWIKPTILGCDATSLGIEAGDDVCYVLPYRSLADLLVIDKACEAANLPRPQKPLGEALQTGAFFYIGQPEGRLGRKTQRQPSGQLTRLLALQSAQFRPIKLIPVSLFWGHQPDREGSWVKRLFSENWTATSRLKKLLSIIFHSNHILVQFSHAIDLSQEEDSATEAMQERKLLRILRVHFNQQKQAILGPDISHRRTLIQSMMTSHAVREAIEKETRTRAIALREVESRALAYANEIASHQSYRVIRFFHGILTWLWNKLYDGIEITNIAPVKELAKDHEIVYVPCHRSHIDYLLLSYVLYHNGLSPPHIAAGKNLNLPIVGSLLRRGGAFFMRRSFQGDALYKVVFDEYLHLMFTRGYSVAYFIEGGRSRTGRTLQPRTGMLSMTMRSFQRDPSKPICFMPVYFGYEKILEDATYLSELSGAAKKDESILDIFRVLGSLKNVFGKVSVNFGKPVHLDAFFDQHLPQWSHADRTETADFAKTCSLLATRLAQGINAAAAINPVNLVATVMLSTPRQNIEETHLARQLETLISVAKGMEADHCLSVTDLSTAAIINEAVQVTGILRTEKPFGYLLSAPPPLPALLTYYRNNTIHVFALPSLIGRLILQGYDLKRLETTCLTLYPSLKAEFFLLWDETEVPGVINRIVDLLAELQLVQRQGDQLLCPNQTSDAYSNLLELGSIIEPTLERFFIVSELLEQGRHLSLREAESIAAAIGQQLSVFYGISAPEFFDKTLFSTLIATLKTSQVIGNQQQMLTLSPAFYVFKQAVQGSLKEEIKVNILQLVHRHLALALSINGQESAA